MKMKITVHGVAYEVDVEVLDPGTGFPSQRRIRNIMPPAEKGQESSGAMPKKANKTSVNQSGNREGVSSPIAGMIVEIKCSNGDNVTKGQVLVVMEAMKMKTSIAAPTDGQIKKVLVAVGDSVRETQMLIELV